MQKQRARKRIRAGRHEFDQSKKDQNPKVISLPLTSIKPYSGNARQHSARQIAQIERSIQSFGFMNPIIIDTNNVIVAGHGRCAAATNLSLAHVPVIRVEHLSDAEVRAYRLADNKLAENSAWDEGLLRVEIEALAELELKDVVAFDLDALGFELGEVDILLGTYNGEGSDQSDDADRLPATPVVPLVHEGDLWQLGRHRIICGTALDLENYGLLLKDERAAMVITDPPYNVPINGHVRSRGRIEHREFAMASGEMTALEFVSFLQNSLGAMLECCAPGALMYVFMDWRHLNELSATMASLKSTQLNLCIWAKTNAGMGGLYRSQHELVGVYVVGDATHRNNVQLGKFGRNRSNVWSYPGVNTFRKGRAADLIDHPTVKPVAMIEDAIRDVTGIGDIVLDGFGGSGTTLLACERCRRTARLIELDAAYVEVTIRRWEVLTGETAVEIQTGETIATRKEEKADV